jgi:AbrB family looped-hinge helix DNA binding protein
MNAQTRVSAKGQIVIPKTVRDELGWPAGTRLQIEKVGGAVTLRPVRNKPGSLTLEEFIARRPKHEGPPLSPEEMDAAVARGMAGKFAKEYKSKR